MDKLRIAAISGSLRSNSSATAILKQALTLFPQTVDIVVCETGKLPHFDDSNNIPGKVSVLRQILKEANGVIICQPEYAFGIAGSLKNALDWTVASGELTGKPVAVITAATGGDKAHAALLLILTALSSKTPVEATLLIPFVRTKLNDTGEVITKELLLSLTVVVNALLQSIYEIQKEENSYS